MKHGFVFFLVLIFISAKAQSQETITKYLDSAWHKLPDAKNAAYYRTLEVTNQLSLVRTYYISGKLKDVTECDRDNPAIRNGKSLSYYEDGTLELEEHSADGKETGVYKTYYKSGKPEKEMIRHPLPGVADDVFVHYYTEDGKDQISSGNGIVKVPVEGDFDQYEEIRDSLTIALYNVHKTTRDTVYLTIEKIAEYRGGLSALARDVSATLRYPKSARRSGLQGTVFVSFVIDKKGMITDVEVLKGFDAACDDEAMAVVKSLKPWIPGESRGKIVKCRFVLPIKFKLRP